MKSSESRGASQKVRRVWRVSPGFTGIYPVVGVEAAYVLRPLELSLHALAELVVVSPSTRLLVGVSDLRSDTTNPHAAVQEVPLRVGPDFYLIRRCGGDSGGRAGTGGSRQAASRPFSLASVSPWNIVLYSDLLRSSVQQVDIY